jgi:MerR family transcriptional regulator, mercuric resistance operon regulatory protein
MDHRHEWTTYRSTDCSLGVRIAPSARKKEPMPQAGMTIGRLAKQAGVNIETIRYYQRRGLIEEPQKPAGGHRRYPLSALRCIAFVRRAQALGFSLAEVQGLLRYVDGRSWRETRQIAEKKFASLELHVKQLRKMRDTLKALIKKSRDGKGRGPCPIITSLNGN